MSIQVRILIIIFAFLLLGFIFELMKRKKIKEAIALWWLFIIISMIFLTLHLSFLDRIRDFLGVALPIYVLLLFSLFFILTILIYFSMKISVLSNQIKDIVQDYAIYKAEIMENIKHKNNTGK